MQTNIINHDTRTNFNAKISPEFISAAKNYYTKTNSYAQSSAKIDRFMHQVGKFEKFGSDDITITYAQMPLEKKQHVLYAVKEGMQPGDYIVLAVKDQFRKLLEKFTHINKYEFDLKTKDI